MIAIIASLLVISVYIALRFQWKYAVPVLIALMHDLLITAGVYALTGREVTAATVAALLTILGYSMYDTIIVFDRVRENVPKMQNAAFSQIVNRSMAEVLTRSLATSFCTLLPVLALLIFGGSTLKDFAFALLVGVASGAYSSIFIASPVLTHWKEREPVYRRRRAGIAAENGGLVPAYATTAARRARGRRAEQRKRRRRAAPDRARRARRQVSRERVPRAGRATSRTRPARAARRSRTKAPPQPEPSPSRARPDGSATRPPTCRPRTSSCPKDNAEAAPETARKTAAAGGRADGHARLGHHGPRALALHDLAPRPLLGRHRRRLPRLDRWARSSPASSSSRRRPPRWAIPGGKATHIAVVLYAVPGALLGMALVYLIGMRREKTGHQAPPEHI